MTYKVSLSNSSNYTVRQGPRLNFKVSAILGAGAADVANLSDLNDVDITGIQDNYVLIYNSATGKFTAENPDNVLSNAVAGGLPADFEAQLDVDLDNRINLDGGGF